MQGKEEPRRNLQIPGRPLSAKHWIKILTNALEGRRTPLERFILLPGGKKDPK